MKKKIAVVTGTRAEYGLLYWTLKGIQQSLQLDLQLFVTGTHLSPEFGLTINEIEGHGFQATEKIEMVLSSDTSIGVGKSVALATIGLTEAFTRQKPDLILLLGDRFEVLAAAQAALISKIPIAHIHGGETTEGAFDEAIRHSVTKMSHLHFVTAETHRRRVIQLGEDPNRVFNVGAPGIENIRKAKFLDLTALEASLNFKLGAKYFLVTFHPETLANQSPVETVKSLTAGLSKFRDYKALITYSNADTYGREIINEMKKYQSINSEMVCLLPSLGELRYLSALKHSSLVIGNSSSGLIEAPSLNIPTVNIGNRQAGRLRGNSIFDCGENESAIVNAINQGLAFKGPFINPYGDGNTSVMIVKTLEKIKDVCLQKRFYDIDFNYKKVSDEYDTDFSYC